TNGVAFRAVTNGTTTVAAAINGFMGTTNPSTAGAGVVVTVAPASISSSNVTVGAGLQRNFNGFLGASQHGGTTVTVTSSQPSVALVSPDAATPGSTSINVVVPNGTTTVPFYVQGVDGQTGTVTITLAASGFSQGVGTAAIVQPAVGLGSLQTTQ